MALQKTIELENNFKEISTFNDAYIKVLSIDGSKDKMVFYVGYSKNSETSEIHRKTFVFTPDLTGPNFIKQCYVYLKSLPEFDGAKDC